MKRVLAALVIVVLLGGGGIAFEMHRRGQQRDERIHRLLESARIELERPESDRDAMLATLRRVKASPDADDRLVRVQARLALALDRDQEAWDTLRPLALRPALDPEDADLAARILARRYAQRGDRQDADRAAAYAEQSYRATDDPKSLFLAWELSARAGAGDRAARLADEMAKDHPDSPFTDLLKALAAPTPDLDALRALESKFDATPPELDLMLARGSLEKDHAAHLDDVVKRVERLLREEPSWVEARHLAAITYHLEGDRDRRDAHLHWLLENAPSDDKRRPGWEAMLDQPVRRR